MIVVKIILWTLLALLILIALALAVPTRLYVRYTNEVFLQVRYLFLKFTIPLTDEQKAKKKPKKPKKEKKKKSDSAEKNAARTSDTKNKDSKSKNKKDGKKKKPNPVVKWLKKLYNKGKVDAIITAFKDIASVAGTLLKPIFKNLRLRQLHIGITVASEDAADTAINYGRLCAGVYPALTILLNIMKYDDYSVDIRPDFDKKSLETDISAEISLVPWVVIGGAVHAVVRLAGYKLKGEI